MATSQTAKIASEAPSQTGDNHAGDSSFVMQLIQGYTQWVDNQRWITLCIIAITSLVDYFHQTSASQWFLIASPVFTLIARSFSEGLFIHISLIANIYIQTRYSLLVFTSNCISIRIFGVAILALTKMLALGRMAFYPSMRIFALASSIIDDAGLTFGYYLFLLASITKLLLVLEGYFGNFRQPPTGNNAQPKPGSKHSRSSKKKRKRCPPWAKPPKPESSIRVALKNFVEVMGQPSGLGTTITQAIRWIGAGMRSNKNWSET